MHTWSLRLSLISFILSFTGLQAQPTPAPLNPDPAVLQPPSVTVAYGDPPAELYIWNRPILTYRATLGGKTPAQRVENTLSRVRLLNEFSLYEDLNLQFMELGSLKGVAFFLDANLILAFTELDLDPESNETLEQAAERIGSALEEVRTAFIDQRSPELIGRGIGISLLATLIFGLVLKALQLLQRRMHKIYVRRAAAVTWMKLGQFDFRSYLIFILRLFLRLGLITAVLTAAYFWIGIVLAQFPFTHPVARLLSSHLAKLMGKLAAEIVSAIPNLLLLAIIFYSTRGLAKLVANLARTLENGPADEPGSWLSGDTVRATRRIAILLVWITGFMIAYPYIPGSDSEAFKGVSVLLGLMISMGSTGMVNQLMSGFVVLYSGSIRTGEFVNMGEVEGVITDINLMSTRVKTPKNEYVIVPNAVLINKNTVNYSRMQQSYRTFVSTAVTIGYDTPWRQVEALLLMAADQTPDLRKDQPPKVLKTELSDWYIRYELRVSPLRLHEKNAVINRLHENILDVFNQYGVQIMSPNFISQPETPVLVDAAHQFPEPAPAYFKGIESPTREGNGGGA